MTTGKQREKQQRHSMEPAKGPVAFSHEADTHGVLRVQSTSAKTGVEGRGIKSGLTTKQGGAHATWQK